jgi:hypothetical protein
MSKRIHSLASAGAIFSLFVSGCGIIGGAFDEPVPGEGKTPSQAATQSQGAPTLSPGETLAAETPVLSYALPADCVQANEITLENVGETICVGGQVFVAYEEHGTFYIDFNQARGGFYMIGSEWDTYDPTSKFAIHQGDCVYANGKIVNVDSIPVMAITPNALKMCPTANETPTP